MRIHILSDLHLEFDRNLVTSPDLNADVVVLAGDIWNGDGAVAWAREKFTGPIVLIAGNHEFYRREVHATRRRLADSARDAGVDFLDDTSAVIQGVRFLGATLWTDFAFAGAAQRESAMQTAGIFMNDFRLIDFCPHPGPAPDPLNRPSDPAPTATQLRRFSPEDSAHLHAASRSFLESALAVPFAGPTVVVTHHLPSRRSVAPRWQGQALNAAFASNLDSLIERFQPALWIHGHTHDSFDYRIGSTRVVCNPRGYLPDEPNPHFDPNLIIQI